MFYAPTKHLCQITTLHQKRLWDHLNDLFCILTKCLCLFVYSFIACPVYLTKHHSRVYSFTHMHVHTYIYTYIHTYINKNSNISNQSKFKMQLDHGTVNSIAHLPWEVKPMCQKALKFTRHKAHRRRPPAAAQTMQLAAATGHTQHSKVQESGHCNLSPGTQTKKAPPSMINNSYSFITTLLY